jgi:predicted O-methyltransferase YrrM
MKNVLICGSGECCEDFLGEIAIGKTRKVNVIAILELNEDRMGVSLAGEIIKPVDFMNEEGWDYLVLTKDTSTYRSFAINAGIDPAKILDFTSSKDQCADVLGLDIDLLPELHSIGEKEYLAQKVMAVPVGGVIVEIGTWAGGSAAFMQHFAKDGVQIYSIDIGACEAARQKWGGLPGVHFIKSDSAEAAVEFSLSVDLLFIDGGHELHNIYMDFSAWSKRLKPGGVVIFHDYAPDETGGVHYPGVKLYLDTLIEGKKLSNIQKITTMIAGQLNSPFDVTLDELKLHYREFVGNVLRLRDDIEPRIQYWLKNKHENLDFTSVRYKNGPFEHNYTAKFNLLVLCYLMQKLTFKHLFDLDSFKKDWGGALGQLELVAEHLIYIDVYRRKDRIDIDDDILSGDLVFPESMSQLDSISSLYEFSKFLTFEKQRLMPLLQNAEALFSKINHHILEQRKKKIDSDKLITVVNSIISAHSRGSIALYGARGELAEEALNILKQQGFDNVIFIDRAVAGSRVNNIRVYDFNDLGRNIDFPEAIMISAQFSGPEIRSFLVNSKVQSAIYPIYDLSDSYWQ